MTTNRERFRQIYLECVNDVLRFWTPSMQAEIARHNVGWKKERTDFAGYLRHSELRYWLAFDVIRRSGPFSTYCDIGGFFGAYPLALKRLGIDVVMTEALGYYSDSFSPLFDYLRREGVRIIDHDPFEEGSAVEGQFDIVGAMAVLEHYPHSQRRFLQFMRSLLAPGGRLYIEVPNIAFWPRRLALLRGYSPLPSVADVYESEVPFLGHHREFTIDELRQLAAMAQLKVIDEEQFNYSFVGPWIKRFISDPLLTVMSHSPSMRECLAIVLTPIAETLAKGKDGRG